MGEYEKENEKENENENGNENENENESINGKGKGRKLTYEKDFKWLNHENKTENCKIICSVRDSKLSSTQIEKIKNEN